MALDKCQLPVLACIVVWVLELEPGPEVGGYLKHLCRLHIMIYLVETSNKEAAVRSEQLLIKLLVFSGIGIEVICAFPASSFTQMNKIFTSYSNDQLRNVVIYGNSMVIIVLK